MALFHFTVTQTKRSKGQSAIASAAYRSGEKLYSEYYGEYSDYTRKRGVIGVFDNQKKLRSGTAQTVNYALHQGKVITLIHPDTMEITAPAP